MFRRKLPVSSIVFGALAVVCGIVALLLMQAWAHRLNATRPDVGVPMPVAMITRDLPRGVTITADMVRDATVPEAFVPPTALTSTADAVGRVLAADVAGGEILTRTRLAGASSGPIAALVPPGYRAVVVPTGLPADPVRPGDLVDVLGAFGGPQSHVETVAAGLEVARVLSADEAPSGVVGTPGTGGPSLILLADPFTAEDLAFALAFAKITVTVEAPFEATGQPSSAATPSSVVAAVVVPTAAP